MLESPAGDRDPGEVDDAYEPPAILWEEPYEPVGFGVSCARLEGQFDCVQGGPTFT